MASCIRKSKRNKQSSLWANAVLGSMVDYFGSKTALPRLKRESEYTMAINDLDRELYEQDRLYDSILECTKNCPSSLTIVVFNDLMDVN